MKAALIFAQGMTSKTPKFPRKDSAGRRRAYRLREIEAETGIPASTLRAMIRKGALNPITGFGRWLISTEDYERLLATRLRNTR